MSANALRAAAGGRVQLIGSITNGTFNGSAVVGNPVTTTLPDGSITDTVTASAKSP